MNSLKGQWFLIYHSSLILRHLKDCPHLSVVSMHSSVRFTGSFLHSDVLRAMFQKRKEG